MRFAKSPMMRMMARAARFTNAAHSIFLVVNLFFLVFAHTGVIDHEGEGATIEVAAFNGFTGRARNSASPFTAERKRASGKALTLLIGS
jgi:hypothetical protein